MIEEKKEIKIKKDKNFKKNLLKIWNWFNDNLKLFLKWLSRIGVKNIFGIFLVSISLFLIFLETIFIALIHSNKEKFEEIINYFYDIKIFDYISSMDYHLITGGGFLIDISIYLSLLFVGLIFWKSKNYFKKFWKSLLFVFALGVVLFSYSFYNSMPRIMDIFEKIERVTGYKDDSWKIEERHFNNGFYKRGFYEVPNERRYFEFYNIEF